MPTLEQLIDEVKTNLQGYSLRQDRITYVNNPAGLTTTSLEILVGSSDNLAKGLIEIDNELIWVDYFNKTSNTLNVMGAPTNPIGRGFQGTTPSPHARYAQVTLAPTFPRVSIQKAINDTIQACIQNSLQYRQQVLHSTHLRLPTLYLMMLVKFCICRGRQQVQALSGCLSSAGDLTH